MLDRFDSWLAPGGPVALTINETYMPVTGRESVFFPPTFAPEEGSGEGPSYVITDGHCLVDSVGSQANRIEPLFKLPPYASLVPQITVQIGPRHANLLDVGHRAADAIVRFSSLAQPLRDAFLAYRELGQAHKLAKIAPTSLVFGVWDSRDTGAKLPRLVSSTIRAFGVQLLERAATYFSSIEEDTRKEMGIDAASLGDKDFPAEEGLVNNPCKRAPGGVIASQGIRREAVLNLVALRALASDSPEATLSLQRYILALALVAFLAPIELNLRQGCLLCLDNNTPPQRQIVDRNGARHNLSLSESDALTFAESAAPAFVVGDGISVSFDPTLVKQALNNDKPKKKWK
jgi:CRISPR-associated protein Csb1